MSNYIRTSKKPVNTPKLPKYVPQGQTSGAMHATIRGPLSPAAVGLASMMLVTGAAAQDSGSAPAPRQDSGAVTQQQPTPAPQPQSPTSSSQTSTTLPQIDVRARRRVAPARPAAVAPAAAPTPAVPAVAGETGYQSNQQTITRLPTPLRDTPQTVNVVTQQVIQDQRLTSMEDALRTVPGITFSAGEGGQQGDSPIIRGFAARGDIFRDGIRDPGWYTRDLFSADRVEVYKGPSAFAFGRGSTGGAINTVSKLPTGATFVDGMVSGTSTGGYRAEVDASGKKDNWSARISAMYQDVPTADRDNVYTKRWGVAPSVQYTFTPDTKVLFSYVYQGEESIPDYGWPYLTAPVRNASTGALTSSGYFGNGAATPPVSIPRNNWFGTSSGSLADLVTTETHILTGKFEHKLAPDLTVTNATRYISNDRFSRPTAPRNLFQSDNTSTVTAGYPVESMTIGRQHFQTETDNTLFTNQTDLTGKFRTGSLEHTFATGVEAARETRDQQRAKGMDASNLCSPTNALCRTSLYSPVDTSYGGVFSGYNPPNSTRSTTLAAYAFDQVKLNKYFELLGSIRYDRFSTEFQDLNTAPVTNLSRTDKMVSWRVGGVFHPTPTSSIYAAHGISYNPSAEFATLSSASTNAANALLAPEKNTTTEIGAKADVLGGKLSLSGAMFRIEKTNLRIPIDPTLNTALVLDGLARVDGIELGAAGKLTDKWQVFAGFSYLDSQIVQTTNLAELGRRLPNTPPRNFTLWTTYDVTPKWTIGGGATYASNTFVNTTNTSYVPAYWKFDLMTSYKVTKNSTWQLNIYNLTNELYFAQYYQGHAVPAAGRSATLSYRVRFEPEPAKPTKTAGYFK